MYMTLTFITDSDKSITLQIYAHFWAFNSNRRNKVISWGDNDNNNKTWHNKEAYLNQILELSIKRLKMFVIKGKRAKPKKK